MVKLIDIEAKDKNDTTPDPLMAMIFFFIATSIYCVICIFLTDSSKIFFSLSERCRASETS